MKKQKENSHEGITWSEMGKQNVQAEKVYLSNCLMNLKNSGDSTGFEPMTSAMPVQCSNQLSYEVTQWRAGHFVGLMFSRERNVYERNDFIYIPFTGKHEPNKLTCSPMCDFIAQLVRALHRHRRGHGFEFR